MNLGLVVFANDSGLGNQTRRLAQMLKPERLLVINSRSFSKNNTQHFEWYDGFSGYTVDGFPNNREVRIFLRGLTHVVLAENPLNWSLISEARRMGIKTYIQSNYEFCDNLNDPTLPLPDKFLMPSYWMIDEMNKRFGDDRVCYLPPPLFPTECEAARTVNFSRSGPRRFLHIVGTLAAADRNGTLDILRALPYTTASFSLIIKSQHPLPGEYMVHDHRLTYKIGNERDPVDLYRDFDALILPRRYGGLSLTCNEALMSGMPVIMPDISPNNGLLPREWLVPAQRSGELLTRAPIPLYTTPPKLLAAKIDWLCDTDLEDHKTQAFQIAFDQFSPSQLKPKYEDILWK